MFDLVKVKQLLHPIYDCRLDLEELAGHFCDVAVIWGASPVFEDFTVLCVWLNGIWLGFMEYIGRILGMLPLSQPIQTAWTDLSLAMTIIVFNFSTAFVPSGSSANRHAAFPRSVRILLR